MMNSVQYEVRTMIDGVMKFTKVFKTESEATAQFNRSLGYRGLTWSHPIDYRQTPRTQIEPGLTAIFLVRQRKNQADEFVHVFFTYPHTAKLLASRVENDVVFLSFALCDGTPFALSGGASPVVTAAEQMTQVLTHYGHTFDAWCVVDTQLGALEFLVSPDAFDSLHRANMGGPYPPSFIESKNYQSVPARNGFHASLAARSVSMGQLMDELTSVQSILDTLNPKSKLYYSGGIVPLPV